MKNYFGSLETISKTLGKVMEIDGLFRETFATRQLLLNNLRLVLGMKDIATAVNEVEQPLGP